ncbi:MAG: type VI secretion system-associated protein TagF [Rubrivivax sp.]|nr:type VI secretion system-associated protein TagF [Rubrivivax sp.]
MTARTAPPGWHGKLPSLGDFASRRLDAAFIEPWDGWLAAGLLALREARPDSWLDAYLGSPSWRFLLMPGVLPGTAGAQAWCGVLMPSVDRVGRYFPLTLVLPLDAGPASAQEGAALWPWLGRLDELARDALYEDWTAERLEDELARMALPVSGAAAPEASWPAAAGAMVELAVDVARDPALHIGAEAQRAWLPHARGRAWWHACPDDQPPRLLLSQGLPSPSALHLLFGAAATI